MAAIAIVLCASVALRAATPALPPLHGELSGELVPLQLRGAPTLKWHVFVPPGAAAGPRTARLEVTGAGIIARGEAALETWNAGAWRITEARLDVAEWFRVVVQNFAPKLSSLTAEGLAVFTGAGRLRAGDFTGRVQVDWRDGVVRDPANGWSIEGVRMQGRLAEIPQLASDGPVTLTFREANGAGIVARDGRIEFAVDFSRRIHVLRAAMGLMAGSVEFTPFIFDPAKPELQTNAEFDHVELSRFAAFLPAVLAEAAGPVSGRVQISWSVQDGLKSANGTLRPKPDEVASIRLAPSPGFLTSRLPENMRERIDLLPKWLGPIRQLFRPVNPAYRTLRAIEMGEARLEVKTLELNVSPEGDVNGRTARIVVMARPAVENSAVESVRFEINVTGPLADLVKLVLEGRVQVRAR